MIQTASSAGKNISHNQTAHSSDRNQTTSHNSTISSPEHKIRSGKQQRKQNFDIEIDLDQNTNSTRNKNISMNFFNTKTQQPAKKKSSSKISDKNS
jgi:hypothetical protein